MPSATICGHQLVSETLSVFGNHTLMVEADAIAEIEERRKSTRAEVDEVAFISVTGSSTRCRIVNVSSAGAAVDVPDAAYIPNRFRLMTDWFEIAGSLGSKKTGSASSLSVRPSSIQSHIVNGNFSSICVTVGGGAQAIYRTAPN
jgi:hypothetical protein